MVGVAVFAALTGMVLLGITVCRLREKVSLPGGFGKRSGDVLYAMNC